MGIARVIAEEMADVFMDSVQHETISFPGDSRPEALRMMRAAQTFDDIYKAIQRWHNRVRPKMSQYDDILNNGSQTFRKYFPDMRYEVDEEFHRTRRGYGSTMHASPAYYFRYLDNKAKVFDKKIGGDDLSGAINL